MRTAWFPLVLVVGLGAMAGCGWKRDLAQGNNAAERDDWVAAAHHYQAAAAAHPDDPALEKRLSEAQDKAIATLLGQARKARESGDLDQAVNLVEQAEDLHPRQLEVGLLREEFIGQMAEGVRAVLADAEIEDPTAAAFETWTTFAARFPVHPETAHLRDLLEEALADEITMLVDSKEFALASERLQAFSDKLPSRTQQKAVQAAWANHLLAQGNTASRNRKRASAWVTTALAAGLTGDTQHATLRDQRRKDFLRYHAVIFGPRLQADSRDDLSRLQSRLEAALEHTPAVRFAPGAPRAGVGGSLRLGAPEWDQGSKPTVAIHEFPGPEREHENPRYLNAKRDIDQAQASLESAQRRENELTASRAAEQRRLDSIREGLRSVEQILEGAHQAHAAAQAEATRAQAGLDEAVGAEKTVEQLNAQRDALQAEVDDAQAVLDQAIAALEAASQGDGDVADANTAVSAARRGLEDARSTLDAAPKPTNLSRELARHVGTRAGQLAEKQRLAEQARAELERQQAPVQDQLDSIARIELRISEVDAEMESSRTTQADAQRQLEAARARLEGVPETIFGPTIERVEIEVLAHVRSCVVELRVDLQQGSERTQRTLTARAETRDDERVAVPEHALEADPLAFPKSDAELQADAQADLARQLRGLVADQLETLRTGQLELAATQGDPEAKLRALLLAWLAGPPNPGKADVYDQPEVTRVEAPIDAETELTALMKERWGLDDLGWLKPVDDGE